MSRLTTITQSSVLGDLAPTILCGANPNRIGIIIAVNVGFGYHVGPGTIKTLGLTMWTMSDSSPIELRSHDYGSLVQQSFFVFDGSAAEFCVTEIEC